MEYRPFWATLFLVPWALCACGPGVPEIKEGDIPPTREISFRYDAQLHAISSAEPLAPDELRIVESVSRAATSRFIQARGLDVERDADGAVRGELLLHRGWRQEFFRMVKGMYERAHALPPGEALYYDPGAAIVYKWVGEKWYIRGIVDHLTGMITTIIEVPTDGLYTFGYDSDDGTIGTLQQLSGDMENVRVLWYDWRLRGMDQRLTLVPDERLEAGTYLLTVHYFEGWSTAGYHLAYYRQAAADSIPEDPRDTVP